MQNIKDKGQSVGKVELKQTDGQTDESDDCIPFGANAVGKYGTKISIFVTT